MNGNSNQSQKESTKGRIQGWKEKGRVFQSLESVRPTNMPARKKKERKKKQPGSEGGEERHCEGRGYESKRLTEQTKHVSCQL